METTPRTLLEYCRNSGMRELELRFAWYLRVNRRNSVYRPEATINDAGGRISIPELASTQRFNASTQLSPSNFGGRNTVIVRDIFFFESSILIPGLKGKLTLRRRNSVIQLCVTERTYRSILKQLSKPNGNNHN